MVLVLLAACLPGALALADVPPAPVPRTGQTDCYQDASTVICTGTGQDGDTLVGAVWPAPRFKGNGDQTLRDNLTGLTWTRNANPAKEFKTWQQALDHVKLLNSQKYLGHDDWRLPNVNELESLVIKQPRLVAWLQVQGFSSVQEGYYWTATTYANYPRYAWSIGTYSGVVAGRAKGDLAYAWPVRGGGSGAVNVPRTGQTDCHNPLGMVIACTGSGQDGELQTGAGWPTPRFEEHVDQTVTDRLTGLAWTKEANAPGPAICRPGAPKNWQGALDHVMCLNANGFLGRRDWRLPNRNELTSLVNRGEPNSAQWLMAEKFSKAQPSSYWSSSTYPYNVWNAWSVNMHDGAVTSTAKGHEIHVWPVRSAR